jgi:uncharacterized protein
MTKGGFSEKRWRTIARLVVFVKPCRRIVVFGSWAKGVWRESSDIDLAGWGPSWNPLDAEHARDLLEERCFPWSVDVILPDYAKEIQLLEHIQRMGFEISVD